VVLPDGVFGGEERGLFLSEDRVHDLYFPFPRETQDHIEISIPAEYRVESLPPVGGRNLGYMSYKTTVERGGAGIQISRRVTLGLPSLPASAYYAVPVFCQDLRSSDDSQIVLRTDPEHAAAAQP